MAGVLAASADPQPLPGVAEVKPMPHDPREPTGQFNSGSCDGSLRLQDLP
jgi:hypothetical protein